MQKYIFPFIMYLKQLPEAENEKKNFLSCKWNKNFITLLKKKTGAWKKNPAPRWKYIFKYIPFWRYKARSNIFPEKFQLRILQ